MGGVMEDIITAISLLVVLWSIFGVYLIIKTITYFKREYDSWLDVVLETDFGQLFGSFTLLATGVAILAGLIALVKTLIINLI
jgi:hypothetical protein